VLLTHSALKSQHLKNYRAEKSMSVSFAATSTANEVLKGVDLNSRFASAIIRELIAAGNQVEYLARSEKSPRLYEYSGES
jgi:hypothetical protein